MEPNVRNDDFAVRLWQTVSDIPLPAKPAAFVQAVGHEAMLALDNQNLRQSFVDYLERLFCLPGKKASRIHRPGRKYNQPWLRSLTFQSATLFTFCAEQSSLCLERLAQQLDNYDRKLAAENARNSLAILRQQLASFWREEFDSFVPVCDPESTSALWDNLAKQTKKPAPDGASRELTFSEGGIFVFHRDDFPAYSLSAVGLLFDRDLIEVSDSKIEEWSGFITYLIRLFAESTKVVGELCDSVSTSNAESEVTAQQLLALDKLAEDLWLNSTRAVRRCFQALVKLAEADEKNALAETFFGFVDLLHERDRGYPTGFLESFLVPAKLEFYFPFLPGNSEFGRVLAEAARYLMLVKDLTQKILLDLHQNDAPEFARLLDELERLLLSCPLGLKGALVSTLDDFCRRVSDLPPGVSATQNDAIDVVRRIADVVGKMEISVTQRHSLALTLAAVLTKLGRHSEADKILEEMTSKETLPQLTQLFKARRQLASSYSRAIADLDAVEKPEVGPVVDFAELLFVKAARVWESTNILEETCTTAHNKDIHAQLANLYLAHKRFDLAERQAHLGLAYLKTHPHPENEVGFSYYYVMAIALLSRGETKEAQAVLEPLRKLELSDVQRIKLLRAMQMIAIKTDDKASEREISEALLKLVPPKSSAKSEDGFNELAFTQQYEMAAFVREVDLNLSRGRAPFIKELERLAQAPQLIRYDGKQDALLLERLAQSYALVGNLKLAHETIHRAIEANDAPKNLGKCYMTLGDIYRVQQEFDKSAEAYQTAYKKGGQFLSALLRAASSYASGAEFEKALALLNEIRTSERDRHPAATDTEEARTLWKRFTHVRTAAGNGGDADVEYACDLLKKVIHGQYSHPGDPYAIRAIVEMAEHPIGQATIAELIATAPFDCKRRIVSALVSKLNFSTPFLEAAISEIPTQFAKASPDVRAFLRALHSYVGSYWHQIYLQGDRQAFESAVWQTISLMWERRKDSVFWSAFLATRTKPLADACHSQVVDYIVGLLSALPEGENDDVVSYWPQVLTKLYIALETQQLQLLSPAYSGREPGVRLVAELERVVYLLREQSLYRPLLSPVVTYESNVEYSVSELQACISTLLIEKITHKLAISTFDWTPEVSIGLKGTKWIDVLIRIAVPEDQPYEAFLQLQEFLMKLQVLGAWQQATKSFFPTKIKVMPRERRRDVLLTLSLHPGRISHTENWDWAKFYMLTVEQNSNINCFLRNNYAIREKCLQAFPKRFLGLESISKYVTTVMDRQFTHFFLTSTENISISTAGHTLKNVLEAYLKKHERTTDAAALEGVRDEVTRFYQIVLTIGKPVMKDFDLNIAIEELIDRCRFFFQDVDFVKVTIGADFVVNGSRNHLMSAFLDMVKNSVDAINQSTGVERVLRFTLTEQPKEIMLEVENTGTSTVQKTHFNFGIGTKNIENVIMRIHRGRFSYGLLNNEDPFTYGISVWLPQRSSQRKPAGSLMDAEERKAKKVSSSLRADVLDTAFR